MLDIYFSVWLYGRKYFKEYLSITLMPLGQAARCRQYYYQTVKITMIVDEVSVSDKWK